MADQSVAAEAGERFRRRELSSQLVSLANLHLEAELPAPRFDRTPVLEFHLRTEAEIDRVAAAIGATPKRHGPEYFTGIDNAELRVRWTALVLEHDGPGVECQRCKSEGFEGVHHDADPTGLSYSREADDPTPVSGARVEPHVGGVTDAGPVDETSTGAGIPVHHAASKCRRPGKSTESWSEVTCDLCRSLHVHSDACVEWTSSGPTRVCSPATVCLAEEAEAECFCAMTEASFMNCPVHGTEAKADY